MRLNALLQLVLTYKAGSPESQGWGQQRGALLLCSCSGWEDASCGTQLHFWDPALFFFFFYWGCAITSTQGFCSVLSGIEPIFTTAAG